MACNYAKNVWLSSNILVMKGKIGQNSASSYAQGLRPECAKAQMNVVKFLTAWLCFLQKFAFNTRLQKSRIAETTKFLKGYVMYNGTNTNSNPNPLPPYKTVVFVMFVFVIQERKIKTILLKEFFINNNKLFS